MSINTVLPWCRFCGTFRIWVMRNFSGCWYFFDLEVLCEVLQQLGNTIPVAVPRNSLLQFPVDPSLLRRFAGSNETERSCGDDVEDEAVVELDDCPGTTKGTKFWVLWRSVSHFWSDVAHDHWATHTCNRALCKVFAKGQYTEGSSSSCEVTKIWRSCTYNCASSFVWTSPLAVTTVMGNLDLLRVSNSPDLKFFFLTCA